MPYKDPEKARQSQIERNRKYRESHPGIRKAYTKQYYEKNRDRQCKAARDWYWRNRDKALKRAKDGNQVRRSGLPLEILEFYLSRGCCICRALTGSNKKYRLSVDHDHDTGEFRGILCSGCNTGLGLFKSDPELLRKAADYIEMHRNS